MWSDSLAGRLTGVEDVEPVLDGCVETGGWMGYGYGRTQLRSLRCLVLAGSQ